MTEPAALAPPQDLFDDKAAPPRPGGAPDASAPAPRVLALAALLIAVLDLTIYRASAGFAHATLLMVMAAAIALALRPRASKTLLGVGLALLLLTGRLCWQSSALTLSLSAFALFAWAAVAAGWPLRIPELLCSQLRSFLASQRGLRHLTGAAGRLALRLTRRPRRLAPLLVPALIVLVFLAVFRSANPLIERGLAPFEDWLGQAFQGWWSWLPSFGRLAFWALAGLIAFTYLSPARWSPARLQHWLGPGEELEAPTAFSKNAALKARTALNTLVAVNVLFLIYNAIDANTLWISGALPEGLSYSAYARQGTAWLTLALALTSLVLGAIFAGELNFLERSARPLRALAWIWLAQNLFLALGTCQRLRVYLDYNGLTRLRIVGAFGITLVVLGLMVVMIKVQGRRSFLWMLRRQTMAFALALLLLALTPLDLLCARTNTRRALAGQEAPLVQITTQAQSAEGLPELIPLLRHPKALVRQGVAAVLRRKQAEIEAQLSEGWRGQEAAALSALAELAAFDDQLKALAPDDQREELEDLFRIYVRRFYY